MIKLYWFEVAPVPVSKETIQRRAVEASCPSIKLHPAWERGPRPVYSVSVSKVTDSTVRPNGGGPFFSRLADM